MWFYSLHLRTWKWIHHWKKQHNCWLKGHWEEIFICMFVTMDCRLHMSLWLPLRYLKNHQLSKWILLSNKWSGKTFNTSFCTLGPESSFRSCKVGCFSTFFSLYKKICTFRAASQVNITFGSDYALEITG